MLTSLFTYHLPTAHIATRPAQPRTNAKLLHLSKQTLRHRHIRNLPALLKRGDILIVNNTAVSPALLKGRHGQKKVECLLLPTPNPKTPNTRNALIRPKRRLKIGDTITFTRKLNAVITQNDDNGTTLIFPDFPKGGQTLNDALNAAGSMPLPPYIRKLRPPDHKDTADYQTVFARKPGAIAAPTAGLHFTTNLLAGLKNRGIRILNVTLHTGPDTFLPVRTQNARHHRLHGEQGHISHATAAALNHMKPTARRIAVGTTTLRLMENAAGRNRRIRPFQGVVRLYILPGYRFRATDMLLTNFHLPRSTLLMLTAAYAGPGPIRNAYASARRNNYRFYSYGDACLLTQKKR